MMKGTLPSILEAVGQTPIVKLRVVARHTRADLYVKCEYLNPAAKCLKHFPRNDLIVGPARMSRVAQAAVSAVIAAFRS